MTKSIKMLEILLRFWRGEGGEGNGLWDWVVGSNDSNFGSVFIFAVFIAAAAVVVVVVRTSATLFWQISWTFHFFLIVLLFKIPA